MKPKQPVPKIEKTPLERAYASGLLDPHYHAPLLRDVAKVLREANIPPVMLYRGMDGLCSKTEVQYITRMRHHVGEATYGLAVRFQSPAKPILDRFGAMAAACLRNYISARVMTLQDVLAAMEEEDPPKVSVLLIPNFLLGGTSLVTWKVSLITEMLYNRQAQGLQTVVYIQHWEALSGAYGSGCEQHIVNHFTKTDITES